MWLRTDAGLCPFVTFHMLPWSLQCVWKHLRCHAGIWHIFPPHIITKLYKKHVYILLYDYIQQYLWLKYTHNCHLLLGTHDSQRCHSHYPEPSKEQNTFYLTPSMSVSKDLLKTNLKNIGATVCYWRDNTSLHTNTCLQFLNENIWLPCAKNSQYKLHNNQIQGL